MAWFKDKIDWVKSILTQQNSDAQPILSRLLVLFGLMVFTAWALESILQILGVDMYWQVIAIVTVAIFTSKYRVFVTQVPELTTVIVIDELLGKWFGERSAYQGPGVLFTYPWEEVKADNVFTNETFSTGELEESVPGKDKLRGIIKGFINAEITPKGAKIFNARGQKAKELAIQELDRLFRSFASSMVDSSKGTGGRISIDDLVDKKTDIAVAFRPYLDERSQELFDQYGLEITGCGIKEVDYDKDSRDILRERATRSQQIDGDKELMAEVSRIVKELYGEDLSPDERRDAIDSVMAGMSATGPSVTNSITSFAGINTADVVKGVVEFLNSRQK